MSQLHNVDQNHVVFLHFSTAELDFTTTKTLTTIYSEKSNTEPNFDYSSFFHKIYSTYPQLIKNFNGTYKRDKKIKITTIDEFFWKCDCFDGSIVNGKRRPFLWSSALSVAPVHDLSERPKIKKLNETKIGILLERCIWKMMTKFSLILMVKQ